MSSTGSQDASQQIRNAVNEIVTHWCHSKPGLGILMAHPLSIMNESKENINDALKLNWTDLPVLSLDTVCEQLKAGHPFLLSQRIKIVNLLHARPGREYVFEAEVHTARQRIEKVVWKCVGWSLDELQTSVQRFDSKESTSTSKTNTNTSTNKSKKIIWLPSAWVECIAWATLQPQHLYGFIHVSNANRQTGQNNSSNNTIFTCFFITMFHSTAHKLLQNILQCRFDNRGLDIQSPTHQIVEQIYSNSIQQQPQTNWQNVLMDMLAQIYLTTLLPYKQELNFRHNDFKLDNVAYQKTNASHVRVVLTDKYRVHQDVHLLIPTNGRRFCMIDFGWSSLQNGEGYLLASLSPVWCFGWNGMRVDGQYTDMIQLAYSMYRSLLMAFSRKRFDVFTETGSSGNINNGNQRTKHSSDPWFDILRALWLLAGSAKGHAGMMSCEEWGNDMYVKASWIRAYQGLFLQDCIRRYYTTNGRTGSTATTDANSEIVRIECEFDSDGMPICCL